MDDFFGGILIMVVLSVAVFSSCSYGKAANEVRITEQCESFDRFSAGDIVYECKQTKYSK